MLYPIALHLRGRSTSGKRLHALATSLQPHAKTSCLVINDRVDVAVAAGVRSVHLPEFGLPTAGVKEAFGHDIVVGRSAHTPADANASLDAGADYVFLGPIWDTGSHPNRIPVGVAALGQVTRGRVVAIGGVTPGRVSSCIDHGAYGVALISAIWDALQPASVVGEICDIFDRVSN